MPRCEGPRRLILRCRLCAQDGLLVEPTGEHPTYAALDHALDHHRDQLLAHPDTTIAALTVAA